MIHVLGALAGGSFGLLLLVIGTSFADHVHNRRVRAHEAVRERRPSPATIAQLQRDIDEPLDDYVRQHVNRELGLTPQQPIRAARPACLTKDCQGDTEEIHLWTGELARIIHTCRNPRP